MMNMDKVLIFGYGNFDRQDDGVAWHVLAAVSRRLGCAVPPSPDEEFPLTGESPDFRFELQLTPELAETVAQYDRVCFVDAHTGALPNDVNVEELTGEYQSSPFTHHITASTVLSFAATLYGARPAAILVSVRGYEFGFERALSPSTAELAEEAADRIVEWLRNRGAIRSSGESKRWGQSKKDSVRP
jgi:hydrogenase maturation protease